MHPTEKALIDYVLAEGPEKERVRVEEHLARSCERCEALVARYRELAEALRADRDPDPPAAWVKRAVALGRPSWFEKLREWCGDLQEDLARLVADSWSGPELAGAGVRGVETERRLRYESDDVELDVRVEALGTGGIVTGQFARIGENPEPLADARYLLSTGVGDAVAGTTDELGEFSERIADLDALSMRVVDGDRLLRFEILGPSIGP